MSKLESIKRLVKKIDESNQKALLSHNTRFCGNTQDYINDLIRLIAIKEKKEKKELNEE